MHVSPPNPRVDVVKYATTFFSTKDELLNVKRKRVMVLLMKRPFYSHRHNLLPFDQRRKSLAGHRVQIKNDGLVRRRVPKENLNFTIKYIISSYYIMDSLSS